MKRFKALKSVSGLVDLGCSGITIPVPSLVEGKIYPQVESDYFLDDDRVRRDIKNYLERGFIEEMPLTPDNGKIIDKL